VDIKNAPGLLIDVSLSKNKNNSKGASRVDVSLSKNKNNRKGASREQYALLGTFTVVFAL